MALESQVPEALTCTLYLARFMKNKITDGKKLGGVISIV